MCLCYHSVQAIVDKICEVVSVHMHVWAVSDSDMCLFKTGCYFMTVLSKMCLYKCLGSESKHFSHLLWHHIQINHILTLLIVIPADWWSAGRPHCQGRLDLAASEDISDQCCSRHNRPGPHGRESDWPPAACHEGSHPYSGRAQQPC